MDSAEYLDWEQWVSLRVICKAIDDYYSTNKHQQDAKEFIEGAVFDNYCCLFDPLINPENVRNVILKGKEAGWKTIKGNLLGKISGEEEPMK